MHSLFSREAGADEKSREICAVVQRAVPSAADE